MELGNIVLETKDFSKVFFGMTENFNFILSKLRKFDKEKVLTVAGSGDSVISFLQQGADVIGADLSPKAIYWTKTKIAFANKLTPKEYSNLMNALNPNQHKRYDLEQASISISILKTSKNELDQMMINAFSSTEDLEIFRHDFFYTTRNYREELSRHSFYHPGKIDDGRLKLVVGDIFTELGCSQNFSHVHLSNVLDYIFIRNSRIKYDYDGTENVQPNYTAMSPFDDCPEKIQRIDLLKLVAGSLRNGGTASTFTSAYFTPYKPMFIDCGQEAGFDIECYNSPSKSIYLKQMHDFYLIFHKK